MRPGEKAGPGRGQGTRAWLEGGGGGGVSPRGHLNEVWAWLGVHGRGPAAGRASRGLGPPSQGKPTGKTESEKYSQNKGRSPHRAAGPPRHTLLCGCPVLRHSGGISACNLGSPSCGLQVTSRSRLGPVSYPHNANAVQRATGAPREGTSKRSFLAWHRCNLCFFPWCFECTDAGPAGTKGPQGHLCVRALLIILNCARVRTCPEPVFVCR